MRRWALWLPLAFFAVVLAVVGYGLVRPPDEPLRSHLVGQRLPAFSLPAALPGRPTVTGAATGEPRLINIFASWCVPCIAEAPQLLQLEAAGARIDAIAIRDTPADIARFLDRHGDPFAAIGRDDASKVQLALGSAGVPETFVVDGNGVIRHQHLGNITEEDVPVLLAELEKAR
ncbi:DsbE family thiol:disulfide interchange protein [Sphingomonas gilva]|uniref:DsbE family thiol:disulfide interchange protein n=1 Tax=Sphingomonas gilva TaxID=2305907 RepID=A0A396RL98_9SPHN|nr:redoxin family protein [Sphingomonas gilva]RHW17060.1 DsbE family thiol:disulfide interchange protein [Sphingomonas gilva]